MIYDYNSRGVHEELHDIFELSDLIHLVARIRVINLLTMGKNWKIDNVTCSEVTFHSPFGPCLCPAPLN